MAVRAQNERAIALYEKLGFEREGECRDAVLIDERYENMIMMAIVDRSRRSAS